MNFKNVKYSDYLLYGNYEVILFSSTLQVISEDINIISFLC